MTKEEQTDFVRDNVVGLHFEKYKEELIQRESENDTSRDGALAVIADSISNDAYDHELSYDSGSLADCDCDRLAQEVYDEIDWADVENIQERQRQNEYLDKFDSILNCND